MNSSSDIILSDTFTLESRAVEVFLTPTFIFWERKSRLVDGSHEVGDSLYRQDHQSISLTDIIGVTSIASSSSLSAIDKSCNCTDKFQRTEFSSCVYDDLVIYYVERSVGHRWKVKQIVFKVAMDSANLVGINNDDDSGTSAHWMSTIRERLAEPKFNRPQQLLVFINPLSGNRSGPSIYAQRIQPLFELAGIQTRVIVTERANHARDILLKDDLSVYSGVVCVGGDGMFSELVHGLLLRTRNDEGLGSEHGPRSAEVQPHLRIGIIPAGSTDAVVYSTNGINDPVTSALHIIVGDCLGLDVMTVHSGSDFLRYNVSLLGYGFYGDIIAESEALRWMGPTRYDWVGFKKFCRHNVYCGEITFLASNDSTSHPRDGQICLTGCSVCSAEDTPNVRKLEEKWHTVRGQFIAVNSFLMSCRCKRAMKGASPHAHLGNGYSDLLIVGNCSRLDYMNFLRRCAKASSDQFDFDFIQVHRVREFRFTPFFDNSMSNESAPTVTTGVRVHGAYDSLHMPSDDTLDNGGAEVAGLSRQRLDSPKSAGEDRMNLSCWNCDGEPLSYPSVVGRVHRQLIKIFSRGIEEETERHYPTGCIIRNCLCCNRSRRKV